MWSSREWEILKSKAKGLTLLKGVEVYATDNHHYLAYGDLSKIPFDCILSPETLVEMVHDEGGFIALAHPFLGNGKMPRHIYELDLDGIETMSTNMYNKIWQDNAIKLCNELQAIPIAGSDGHDVDAIGRFGIELDWEIGCERELINALKSRKFRCFSSDEL